MSTPNQDESRNWRETQGAEPPAGRAVPLRLDGAGESEAVEESAGASGSGDTLASKRVFTTGEAAALCKVSQQTIIRCFDAGRLHGFRVPGSKFRRIPRDELLRFMRANQIPTEALEAAEPPSRRPRRSGRRRWWAGPAGASGCWSWTTTKRSSGFIARSWHGMNAST